MNGRLVGTSRPLDQEAQEVQTKDEGVLEKEGKMLPNRNRIRSMGDASSWLREQAFRATGQDIHSNDQYLHQARHNSYLRDQAETAMVLNIFRQF